MERGGLHVGVVDGSCWLWWWRRRRIRPEYLFLEAVNTELKPHFHISTFESLVYPALVAQTPKHPPPDKGKTEKSPKERV